MVAVRSVVIVAVVVFAIALFGSTASANESPLDVGETNLLVLACHYATSFADHDHIAWRNCRRFGAEVVEGNTAILTVRIATDRGAFKVTFWFTKSLWSASTWEIAPA